MKYVFTVLLVVLAFESRAATNRLSLETLRKARAAEASSNQTAHVISTLERTKLDAIQGVKADERLRACNIITEKLLALLNDLASDNGDTVVSGYPGGLKRLAPVTSQTLTNWTKVRMEHNKAWNFDVGVTAIGRTDRIVIVCPQNSARYENGMRERMEYDPGAVVFEVLITDEPKAHDAALVDFLGRVDAKYPFKKKL